MEPTVGDHCRSRSSRTAVFAVTVLAVAVACSGSPEVKTLRATGGSSATTTTSIRPGGSGSADVAPGTQGASSSSSATEPADKGGGSGAPGGGTSSKVGGTASPGGGTPSGDSGTQTGGGGGTRSTDTTTAKHKASPRSYPKGGAVDSVYPPGTPAYKLLSTGDCAGLLKAINEGVGPPTTAAWSGQVPDKLFYLYRSAAEVCLTQWASAEPDFGLIGGKDFAGICAEGVISNSMTTADCLRTREQVYDWVAGLLADHAADPSFVPEFH